MRAALLYAATAVAAATSRYSVTIVPVPQVFTKVSIVAINSSGQVSGNGTNSSNRTQPFVIGSAEAVRKRIDH
jgi:hypothetical protein